MNEKIDVIKKLVDIQFGTDEFEDILLDLESVDTFLELLPDLTVSQINEDLKMYLQ